MNNIIETKNIGKNFVLGEFSIIRKDVVIGDNVEIREMCVIGTIPVVFTEKIPRRRIECKGDIRIGDNVFINNLCAVNLGLVGTTIIEDGVIFGGRVNIGHDSHIHKNVQITGSSTLLGHVDVGENTFIGANTTVRNRIRIGKNSIIGQNSNVVKDVPDNVIAYGNPCVAQDENTFTVKAMRKIRKETRKWVRRFNE
jgi:UDP-3-O-[3-hydroxymyristoyl] glucosamine N-acyltransferase